MTDQVSQRVSPKQHGYDLMRGRIVRMHLWKRVGKGHRCETCGSEVGVSPGLDSVVFPCPGPPIVRRRGR